MWETFCWSSSEWETTWKPSMANAGAKDASWRCGANEGRGSELMDGVPMWRPVLVWGGGEEKFCRVFGVLCGVWCGGVSRECKLAEQDGRR